MKLLVSLAAALLCLLGSRLVRSAYAQHHSRLHHYESEEIQSDEGEWEDAQAMNSPTIPDSPTNNTFQSQFHSPATNWPFGALALLMIGCCAGSVLSSSRAGEVSTSSQSCRRLHPTTRRGVRRSSITSTDICGLLLAALITTAKARNMDERRTSLERHAPFAGRVIGKSLGVGLVLRQHAHKTVSVEVNLTMGFEQLDPDGVWATTLRQQLCRSMPELNYNCVGVSAAPTSPTSPDGGRLKRSVLLGFGIGAAVAVIVAAGGYAYYRFSTMETKLRELGEIVDGSLTQARRDRIIHDTMQDIVHDWASISATGKTPIGFWSNATKEAILDKAGFSNATRECYLQPRVMESLATIHLAGKQTWPILRLEIRLPDIHSCGKFVRNAEHIGILSPTNYGYLNLPPRLLVTDTLLTAVSNCSSIALNTYICESPPPPEALVVRANYSCSWGSQVSQPDRCPWRRMTWNATGKWKSKCFAHVVADVDNSSYVMSTNCKQYYIDLGAKKENLTFSILQYAHVRVYPRMNEALVVAGQRYPGFATPIHGKMERTVELELWKEDYYYSIIQKTLRHWLDDVGGSPGDGNSSSNWWQWIAVGVVAGLLLLLIGLAIGCCLRFRSGTVQGTSDAGIELHNYLKADQSNTWALTPPLSPPNHSPEGAEPESSLLNETEPAADPTGTRRRNGRGVLEPVVITKSAKVAGIKEDDAKRLAGFATRTHVPPTAAAYTRLLSTERQSVGSIVPNVFYSEHPSTHARSLVTVLGKKYAVAAARMYADVHIGDYIRIKQMFDDSSTSNAHGWKSVQVVYAEAVDEQGGDGLVVLQAPDDTDLCTDELARDTELALDEASCIALGLYSEQGHTLTTTHGRVNLNAETPCFVADTGGPDDDAAPGTGPVINALNGRLLGIISNNNSIVKMSHINCVLQELKSKEAALLEAVKKLRKSNQPAD